MQTRYEQANQSNNDGFFSSASASIKNSYDHGFLGEILGGIFFFIFPTLGMLHKYFNNFSGAQKIMEKEAPVSESEDGQECTYKLDKNGKYSPIYKTFRQNAIIRLLLTVVTLLSYILVTVLISNPLGLAAIGVAFALASFASVVGGLLGNMLTLRAVTETSSDMKGLRNLGMAAIFILGTGSILAVATVVFSLASYSSVSGALSLVVAASTLSFPPLFIGVLLAAMAITAVLMIPYYAKGYANQENNHASEHNKVSALSIAWRAIRRAVTGPVFVMSNRDARVASKTVSDAGHEIEYSEAGSESDNGQDMVDQTTYAMPPLRPTNDLTLDLEAQTKSAEDYVYLETIRTITTSLETSLSDLSPAVPRSLLDDGDEIRQINENEVKVIFEMIKTQAARAVFQNCIDNLKPGKDMLLEVYDTLYTHHYEIQQAASEKLVVLDNSAARVGSGPS